MAYTRPSTFHLQKILSWLSATCSHASAPDTNIFHSGTHAATAKVAIIMCGDSSIRVFN